MSSETPRTASTEWKWRRAEVIIRDDYTCQECGDVGGPEGDVELHVHHITPISDGGGDDPQNLMTLCKDCHNNTHSNGSGEDQKDCETSLRNPNRDEESGKYAQGYTPSDAVDALRELDGAATTSEVGEVMGCARRTAYNKLQAAEEDNLIRSRDAGRSRLWLLAGDE